jgi:K+ transporter
MNIFAPSQLPCLAFLPLTDYFLLLTDFEKGARLAAAHGLAITAAFFRT